MNSNMLVASQEDEIRVLFVTEGCVITYSLLLLTGRPTLEELYVVSYCGGKLLDRESCIENEAETGDRNENTRLTTSGVKVVFCLLGNALGGAGGRSKDRVRPIFICRFNRGEGTKALRLALVEGAPLQTSLVRESLDEEETFALHNDLLVALAVVINRAIAVKGKTTEAAEYDPDTVSVKTIVRNFPRGQRGLATLYIDHEQRVLAAYRRLYGGGGSVTTPFWFISKFGPDEKSLVLVTRYYLLQAVHSGGSGADYDLQAVKDFCLTYDVKVGPNPTGLGPAELVSFSLFSKYCCQSEYARGPVATGFPLYVESRIAADVAEVGALREFITHDRKSLRVSDRELITYVYLAHFECFNRERLTCHLKSVTTTEPKNDGRYCLHSNLGANAIENFFGHVRSQFNIEDYIKQNVQVSVTKLPENIASEYAVTRTYGSVKVIDRKAPKGVWDCSSQMAKHVAKVEAAMSRRGWPIHSQAKDADTLSATDIALTSLVNDMTSLNVPSYGWGSVSCGVTKRLLSIASAGATNDTPTPLGVFTGYADERLPCPVYRISMSGKRQAFAILIGDVWEKVTDAVPINTLEIQVAPRTATEEIIRDMKLTQKLLSDSVCRTYICSGPVSEQMYINRNEIFNSGLAIGNIILDVDFNIRHPVPAGVMHAAMRGFRKGALTALALLMREADVDWETHPCYFYKSSCPKTNGESCMDDIDGINACNSEELDDIDLDRLYYEEEARCLEILDADVHLDQIEDRTDVQKNEADQVILENTSPCGCTSKIGMRVCIPVPPPYILSGADTITGIARIIQHGVLLERSFVESIGGYLKDYSFVDTGVYAHGRSLRLPFFYKVADEGVVSGRLLPFFVVPSNCYDIGDFVKSHYDPTNFHFHTLSVKNKYPRHVIYSLGGEYVSFFDRKVAHNRDRYLSKRASLASVLGKYGVDCSSESAVESFVLETVLEGVIQYLVAHYPDKSHEYKSIFVRSSLVKPDWLLLQLIPSRGSGRQGFSCVRYKHSRNNADTVRTFLCLSVDAQGKLCASVSQQCFATKCGNNRLHTLFTIDVATTCS
ncbi:helicase-primase primase subunit [Spheniscid alphaherpesvirus 1]|uniref:Helicase-primase primase subunit n=1 Tax=Spheniscid alphaherpesvirus 1 TaxID=2560777 RepID=A0A1R3T876_9ALPH|nr:helicase-primase primase subunit [Spheniscid alphaherpesvirus 1]SCO83494.1 helicase-primase primase subunit [Spheniscid alphaherpesvirus 1]